MELSLQYVGDNGIGEKKHHDDKTNHINQSTRMHLVLNEKLIFLGADADESQYDIFYGITISLLSGCSHFCLVHEV